MSAQSLEDRLLVGNYKSDHIINDFDGGIYISNHKFEVIHREYETFIDSKDNSHQVQMGYTVVDDILKDEHFYVNDNFLDCKKYRLEYINFNFNLKTYCVINTDHYNSKLNQVRNLIDGIDSKYDYKYANYRDYRFEDYEYFPIFEHVFSKDERYVTDRVFFSYKNKEKAISIIDYNSRKRLKDLDYVNWDDNKLRKFLIHRLQAKAEYDKLYKNN